MRLEDAIELQVAKLVAEDRYEIHAAGKPYSKIVKKANNSLQKQLGKFERGKINSETFVKKTQSILSNAYDEAFIKGSGRKVISPMGRKWLSQFKDKQFKYLEGFANAIDEGSTIMSTSQRMGLYANSIRSSYWRGSVAGSSPYQGFDWVTFPGENCEDCLELEQNSPYTRASLPTVPGQGDTRCGSNCNCKIIASE